MQELDLRDVVLDTLQGLKVTADAKGCSLVATSSRTCRREFWAIPDGFGRF